jgi:hypothetical protein
MKCLKNDPNQASHATASTPRMKAAVRGEQNIRIEYDKIKG